MYPPVPRNSYKNVIKLQNINVKKLRFRHELTANDTSIKLQKLQKGDITQQHIDDVLVGNITFFCNFLQF